VRRHSRIKCPRRVRHPFVAVPLTACSAVVCGTKSFAAINEWAADAPQNVLAQLGARTATGLAVHVPPARDDDWWAAFTRGDVPQDLPSRPPTRSRAHTLLAALGRETPSLSLSAAECAALAPLVTAWFARGATEEVVRHAMTSGLPTPVHHPAALLRRSLTDKLPAEPPPDQPPHRILECAECRARPS
jgi:hypothetical protein